MINISVVSNMKILFILLVILMSSGVAGFKLCVSKKYCVTVSIAPTCLEVPHVINKSLSKPDQWWHMRVRLFCSLKINK